MSQCFIGRENSPEDMKMEWVKVNSQKVWKICTDVMYFEDLDLVVCGIKGRFDQPGYEVYSNLEGMLVKAVRKDNYDEDLQYIVDFYKGDFNRDQLSMQLGVCQATFQVI